MLIGEDIREINGYSIQFTPFHPAPFTTTISSAPATEPPADASSRFISTTTTISAQPDRYPPSIKCLVYIGLPENPQFLGPQHPQELARHILKSRGPSGENREYLFMLEKALLELSRESEDKHISDLVRRCREIEAEKTGGSKPNVTEAGTDKHAVGVPLHHVGSTEEQEEVEKES